MLKKYAAIAMMTIAYAILLGHSIIPHHHHHGQDGEWHHHDHELEVVSNHHHIHHSPHEHHEGHNDLSDIFHHLFHFIDGENTTIAHNMVDLFYAKRGVQPVVGPVPVCLEYSPCLHRPLRQKMPLVEVLICFSPQYHSSGLRAPPALSV